MEFQGYWQRSTAFAEFAALTKTIAGGTEAVASANAAANNAKMVADFLAGPLPAGFPGLSTPAGAELAQILKGEKQITPELHSAVKAKLDSMIADREWGKRFEAKDQTATRGISAGDNAFDGAGGWEGRRMRYEVNFRNKAGEIKTES